jgi:hypothetical protein
VALLNDRMASIDTNLDDLQSGLEACSRAADILHADTTKFSGFLDAPLLRAVLGHVKELLLCARDQRVALQELRGSVARLQSELESSQGAGRPPPVIDPHPARRR